MHRCRHGHRNHHRAGVMRNFSIDIHGEGIALVTWDMPGKSMNVIDETVMDELEIIVGRIRSDMEIKGAIITSAKSTFSGGADLGMLSVYTTQRQAADDDAKRDLLIKASRLSRLCRS